VALDDERLEIGARGVDSGCITGTARADDDDISHKEYLVELGSLENTNVA
jgi:hypothetical protein